MVCGHLIMAASLGIFLGRDCVPCTGRQILIHCTTKEVLPSLNKEHAPDAEELPRRGGKAPRAARLPTLPPGLSGSWKH